LSVIVAIPQFNDPHSEAQKRQGLGDGEHLVGGPIDRPKQRPVEELQCGKLPGRIFFRHRRSVDVDLPVSIFKVVTDAIQSQIKRSLAHDFFFPWQHFPFAVQAPVRVCFVLPLIWRLFTVSNFCARILLTAITFLLSKPAPVHPEL
jgi:hypothetical protein